MPYDYERANICKATGLTGVQAEHICNKLREKNIDPQAIDWSGAISDSRDWGDRYQAVQKYLANYYGVSFAAESPEAFDVNRYDLENLEFQASTKKGVKQLLNDYFNSKRSKKQKEQIKELLLSEGPLYNVLMTAMYDGVDLPNARRFLNEAMKGEVVDVEPAVVTPIQIKRPVVEPEVVETPVEPVVEPVKAALVEVRPGFMVAKPVRKKYIRPEYKVLKNGNGKKKSTVDLEKLYSQILKQKQKEREFTREPVVGERKPLPVITKKKSFLDVFAAGLGKEGERWKKLLTQQKGPKRGSVEALKREVEMLRLRNMPLQLDLERQRLLMQREQMLQLQRINRMQQRKSSVQHALGLLGFAPPQQQFSNPLMRPGYYIETRPKLPPGFRYKKVRKKDIERMKEHMDQPNPMVYMY